MLNTFDDTDMELIANYYDVDLGDKTLIKVDVCKTGEGFLWFCKKVKKNMRESTKKRVILFKKNWESFKVLAGTMKNILDRGDEGSVRMKLSSGKGWDQYFEMCEFNGVQYIGIHRYDPKGKRMIGRCLNMTKGSFFQLMGLIAHIDSLLEEVEAKNCPPNSPVPPQLSVASVSSYDFFEAMIKQARREQELCNPDIIAFCRYNLYNVQDGSLEEHQGGWGLGCGH